MKRSQNPKHNKNEGATKVEVNAPYVSQYLNYY